MQVNEIIAIMNRLAPPNLAEEWDNVGLLVGDDLSEVKRILITLDVTPEVIKEAIALQVDLIIAHHPIIFKGIKSITNQTVQGQMLLDLIRHHIHVYVAHTNLDSVNNGMNDWLAKQLNLNSLQVLVPTYSEKLYQLSVCMPKNSLQNIKDALFKFGISQMNQFEQSEEVKIEVQVTQHNLSAVVKAIEQAHPYQTPLYNIISLEQKNNMHGLGKIGNLAQSLTLLELAKQCKQAFNTPMVKMIGPANKIINKVAIVGGSGSSFMQQAQAQGADAYITGDVTYHTALEAVDLNIAIIDAGHYIEHIIKSQLSQILADELQHQGVDIIQSAVNTNPYKYIMS